LALIHAATASRIGQGRGHVARERLEFSDVALALYRALHIKGRHPLQCGNRNRVLASVVKRDDLLAPAPASWAAARAAVGGRRPIEVVLSHTMRR